MDSGFITLMRKLAPDLIDEITRRALILERIAAMQPVGRRQLAAKLNLPEREIRNTAAILKDLGYIDLDASGMSLSDKAEEVLHWHAEKTIEDCCRDTWNFQKSISDELRVMRSE